MEKVIRIENIDIFDLLERCYYDFQSKKNIVEYILINYPELKLALWEEYKKEYEKAFVSYELAKENFTKYLINILEKDNFNWTVVSFSEKTVKVEEK